MMRDYKPLGATQSATRPRVSRTHWVAVFAMVLLASAAVTMIPHQAEATRVTPEVEAAASSDVAAAPVQVAMREPEAPSTPVAQAEPTAPLQGAPLITLPAPAPAKELTRHTVTIRSGDSLSKIFSRLGLSAGQLHELLELGKDAKALARIAPGQTLKIAVDSDNNIQELVLEFDRTRSLHINRHANGFTATTIERKLDSRVRHANGTIETSLFVDGQRVGLPDGLIMELAGIFGWDIDFALDIRDGDNFTVIYEEKMLDGQSLRHGPILAAEFTNRGKTYRGIRYTDPAGKTRYFSPDGRNLHKAFLRSPVEFSRISSRFGKRHHPVLNRMRMHNGVDYAAPRGTPIRATGDGKIVFRGTKGGYGKTVIIQHGSKYSTLYAHMSNFRRGQKTGKTVRQGEVIGYIGSSGLATGPHLHYEFRLNGAHRNPLTVKLPDAEPIDPRYRQDFQTQAAPLLAQLEQVKGTAVALRDE